MVILNERYGSPYSVAVFGIKLKPYRTANADTLKRYVTKKNGTARVTNSDPLMYMANLTNKYSDSFVKGFKKS